MKPNFILISLVIIFSSVYYSYSQSGEHHSVTTKALLGEATVFFTGAELVHTATVTLVSGENSVEIGGLSPAIDISSLRIKAGDGVMISSYDFKIEQLATEKIAAPTVKVLRDSVELVRNEIQKLDISIKINNQMLALLKSGVDSNISGTDQWVNMDELVESIESYRSKAGELELEGIELTAKRAELGEKLQRLATNYSLETVKWSKKEGVLSLNVAAPVRTGTTFTLTYFTNEAYWTPFYDINIGDIDSPVEFSMKSRVVQTTGLDWEKVKLTLSTTVPSRGNTAPLFSTWFLEPVSPEIRAGGSRLYKAAPTVQNSYSYAEEAADEVMAMAYGSQRQSSEPIYIINGIPATASDFASIDPDMILSVDVLKDSDAAVYGAAGNNGVVVVTTKSSVRDYVSVDDNTTGVVYNIDLLYTIPGNGREQIIELGKKEASARFKYYCAPRLDAETFLIAEIADWSRLGFLSGKANITFDGTYLGETYIDASSTHENLTLTLGTDKRVVVTREKLDDFSSRKTLANDIQQVFAYKLTVRNNNTKPVDMVLKEQYPRSTSKDIEVTLLTKETTPWTFDNEEVGVLTWEEPLQPGETRTYRISYQVKYPKNVTLNLR